MASPIDTSSFQLGVPEGDDPDEEGPLLDQLTEWARDFVQSHRWAPPISELLLAFGIGGVIGLFLVRFAYGIGGAEGKGDREIWVVVGDMPSIYFETENIEDRAAALSVYCSIAEEWADRVLRGRSLVDCFPIPAAPTTEHAFMLKSRIAIIRRTYIPLVE